MPDAPALLINYRGFIESGHKRMPGGWLYKGEFYPDYLTVGGGLYAIKRIALKYCKGDGLDIGASFWPLPGSLPIDNCDGPGTANRLEDIPDRSQDFVFSSHCLEHIADWQAALDVWTDKLKQGGILFLYLPHPSCGLWRMDNPAMKDIHRWVPTIEIIEEALVQKGYHILEKDEGPDHFFSFYVCAQYIG
jgi:SAM-dependent methyltransferase